MLECCGVMHAAIFGSIARGDAKENNDLDILIEFKGEKSMLDLIRLKIELEDVLKREVGVVEYSAVHPYLKERISKEQVAVL